MEPEEFVQTRTKNTWKTPGIARPESIARKETSSLRDLEQLGYFLDQSIRIPIIGYRVGYDAIFGLLPGAGDAVGLVMSGYILFRAIFLGVPFATLLRMAANIGIETVIGVVPFLGDVFDATWKANIRNLKLIHEHVHGSHATNQASNRRYFAGIAALLVGVLIGLGVLVYFLSRLLLGWLNGGI